MNVTNSQRALIEGLLTFMVIGFLIMIGARFVKWPRSPELLAAEEAEA